MSAQATAYLPTGERMTSQRAASFWSRIRGFLALASEAVFLVG